jgi:hypothetical protein
MLKFLKKDEKQVLRSLAENLCAENGLSEYLRADLIKNILPLI